ncbi:UDP-N-acetylmuramoyl-L-alanine--D-glutamate ligase [Bacteroidia bacterium]|nr:UDP-N-acetylmuramoyl-L-alanine--D-glutamate ligase [Bacteroidia bacterium]
MIKKISILGSGESGTGTAILANKLGMDVFLSDLGIIKDSYVSEINELNIDWEQGKHSTARILDSDVIVKSPGIPNTASIVKEALSKNIPVISEMEFAQPHSKAKVIGITGTNGKTTTTTLIHHLLESNGMSVKMAGNIGLSYARQVADLDPDYFVLELSSFQLDDCKTFKVDIAILLNISPDHLDRYDNSLAKYAASKFKITQNQTASDVLIYCLDDKTIQKYWPKDSIESQLIPFSLLDKVETGAWLKNESIELNIKNKIQHIPMKNITIKGKHNTHNSMAAGVVASLLDLKNDQIKESFLSFSTIEHRLEFVGKIQGVKYINDSKATNVNSAWYALESMTNDTIWIAGGVDKGNDYTDLKPLVRDKVRMIVCLGLDNSKIHEAFQEDVEMIINVGTAQEAVHVANRMSKNGENVLLSPACASFDLFDDYQDRGRQFKRAVLNL